MTRSTLGSQQAALTICALLLAGCVERQPGIGLAMFGVDGGENSLGVAALGHYNGPR